MRFVILVLLIALGLFAYQHKSRFVSHDAPAIAFNDLWGNSHTLAKPAKPVLLGFWISDCRYCQNMLGILNTVSGKYPNGQIDVYGFYLNARSESEISGAAGKANFMGIVVAAQQNRELIAALQNSFGIRGPGRDAYVIDKTGALHSVSLVDGSDHILPESEVDPQIQALLQQSL